MKIMCMIPARRRADLLYTKCRAESRWRQRYRMTSWRKLRSCLSLLTSIWNSCDSDPPLLGDDLSIRRIVMRQCVCIDAGRSNRERMPHVARQSLLLNWYQFEVCLRIFWLSLCCRVLPKQLPQVPEKFTIVMEHKGSSLSSQNPTVAHSSEPVETHPYLHWISILLYRSSWF